MKLGWMAIAFAACVPPPQQYTYQSHDGGGEKTLSPQVRARVVSAEEAKRSGLIGRPIVLPFSGPRDGTAVIGEYLELADRADAALISELAIVLESTRDGRAIACRSEIVPEAVTEHQARPASYRTVPVSKPVQRMVTEHAYRCKPVTRSELRTVHETEQRCGSVSRPVQRSRTVYSTTYDYSSKSTRSVPRTEYYTEHQSHYECKSQPVTRTRSELVTKSECGLEPVTRMVTRYEFQLESQYVPPHLETITRQRLRELEPVCEDIASTADDPEVAPPARAHGNRIEGQIFVRR
jgi:hypothetical protein